MKRLLLLAGVLSLLSVSVSIAQVQYSVSNYMRYGNGTQIVGGQQVSKYIENQANVRLFWDDFTLGFEHLYDDPPEFGPRFNGIRKRYVEFAREGLELRAGDFYTLYGKGLAMNLFENRGINYDTRLDGIRGIYRNEWANAIFAMGKMRYYDLLNSERIESYSVKSGHLELLPASFVRVGASMVGAEGELPSAFGLDMVHADIPEAMLSLQGYGFDMHVQKAWKRSTFLRPQANGTALSDRSYGDATYGSLSYTSDIGLGVTFEYKDYRFDVVGEEERDPNRPGRMLPMQNPPIVHKEHVFTLLSRAPHVVDFNDEIGMQMDVYYAVFPTLTVNLNAAAASRHNGYTSSNGFLVTWERDVSFMPTMDAMFSPFWELYGELEWYYEGGSFIRAAFNRRWDNQYEGNLGHVQASTTIPVRIEYLLDETWSLGLNLEQQFAHDSYSRGNPDFYNEFISLSIARAGQWTATVRVEYTTDKSDASGKDFWRAAEFAYRIGTHHAVTLMYGTERGGLICSSGVCREVLPFDGMRLSIQSQL